MKTYYITYTKENILKCKACSKTMTRRVIEKIDHYKNIQPGDLLITRKNRFSKVEVDRNEVVKTWTGRVQDITVPDIHKEGLNFIDVCSIEDDVNKDYTVKDFLNLWIKLWNSINEKRGYGWNTNPRVRVIEFKQLGGKDD